MMYMGWQDTDKHRTTAVKLQGALERYQAKHGRPATVALLNPEQLATLGTAPLGVAVAAAATVALDVFLVGEA